MVIHIPNTSEMGGSALCSEEELYGSRPLIDMALALAYELVQVRMRVSATNDGAQ